MIIPQIQVLINRAEESHQAAKVLLDAGSIRFSAAWFIFRLVGNHQDAERRGLI